MHKMNIQNFGPINNCTFVLSDFTILIGPQSSGKSTVTKLVYFFLNIRDEFVDFILDTIDDQKDTISVNDFNKRLRRRFVEFWGPTPLKSNVYIHYEYNDNAWIEIKLDSVKHKFVTTTLCQNIVDELYDSFNTAKNVLVNAGTQSGSKLFTTTKNIYNDRSRGEIIENIRNKSKLLFNIEKELLFIPAGRSLLSTLSDQLQFIHPHQLDYTMRTFIERINLTKSFFGKSSEDIIRERQALGNTGIWFSAIKKVSLMIRKILKGEFIHDKDGGKLYVDKNTYTKINFASSGQQESIWILLSLFLVVLDKVDALVFIEEPEAHLFPIAQKDIVELMCFLSKTLGTSFVVTSHSPYILSSLNNHIYASVLGDKYNDKVSEILPENTWLQKNKVDGYFIDNGTLTSLFDSELNMLKTELIDSASDIVNNEYNKLFDIECELSQ